MEPPGAGLGGAPAFVSFTSRSPGQIRAGEGKGHHFETRRNALSEVSLRGETASSPQWLYQSLGGPAALSPAGERVWGVR